MLHLGESSRLNKIKTKVVDFSNDRSDDVVTSPRPSIALVVNVCLRLWPIAKTNVEGFQIAQLVENPGATAVVSDIKIISNVISAWHPLAD